MNIVLLIIAILFASLLLTLRSMKEFLPELRHPPQKQSESRLETTTKTVAESEEPPLIVGPDQLIDIYNHTIAYLKNNPQKDTAIECINLGGQSQYIFYKNHTKSIWSSTPPQGYIVDEGLLHQLENPEILARQFILRHKYNDVFYVSERRVIREPQGYIESSLDQSIWERFYKHEHNITLGVSTQQIVLSKLLGQPESNLRRTI